MKPLRLTMYKSTLGKTICKTITLPGVWEEKAIRGCTPRTCMVPMLSLPVNSRMRNCCATLPCLPHGTATAAIPPVFP